MTYSGIREEVVLIFPGTQALSWGSGKTDFGKNHVARGQMARFGLGFYCRGIEDLPNSIVGRSTELSQEDLTLFQNQISGGVGLNEISLHDKSGNQDQGSGLFESIGGLFFLPPEKNLPLGFCDRRQYRGDPDPLRLCYICAKTWERKRDCFGKHGVAAGRNGDSNP